MSLEDDGAWDWSLVYGWLIVTVVFFNIFLIPVLVKFGYMTYKNVGKSKKEILKTLFTNSRSLRLLLFGMYYMYLLIWTIALRAHVQRIYDESQQNYREWFICLYEGRGDECELDILVDYGALVHNIMQIPIAGLVLFAIFGCTKDVFYWWKKFTAEKTRYVLEKTGTASNTRIGSSIAMKLSEMSSTNGSSSSTAMETVNEDYANPDAVIP